MSTVAFCQPGHEIEAAISLAIHGVHVDQIKAHAWLDEGELLVVHEAHRFVVIPPFVAEPAVRSRLPFTDLPLTMPKIVPTGFL